MRHRRAPPSRPAFRGSVSDHPGPRQRRARPGDGGALRDVEGRDIAPGALVTFYDVYGICGACWHCLVARSATRCPQRRVYGITAPASEGLLGGWAERIEILPGVRLVPLPEGLEPEDFLGGGLRTSDGLPRRRAGGDRLGRHRRRAGQRPRRSERRDLRPARGSPARPGRRSSARAPGCRSAARRRGHARHHRRPPRRGPRAPGSGPHGGPRRRRRDRGLRQSGAVPEGLEMLRDAGRFVVVGQYTDSGDATINPHRHVNRKHATVLGCWGYEFSPPPPRARDDGEAP